MLIDTILGFVGLGVSVFAIVDIRRQRSQREKAVIAAHAVIERVYGSLIHLKPTVTLFAASLPNPAPLKAVIAAIDDTLEAVNQKRDSLQAL